MPKTLISSEEMGGALIAYAKRRGSVPEDAVIKNVIVYVINGGAQDSHHYASIEWERAKCESGEP